MDFALIYLSVTTCVIFILFHLGNPGSIAVTVLLEA